MGFKLPDITHTVDLKDWTPAYAGIEVTFHLNPPIVEYVPPWAGIEDEKEREKARTKHLKAQPWHTEFYHVVARQIVSVRFPPEMTESGQEEVVRMDTPEAFWKLENDTSFDPGILTWALRQYSGLRNEWLQGALKNSASASGKQPGS
jgi:hypothetical protein